MRPSDFKMMKIKVEVFKASDYREKIATCVFDLADDDQRRRFAENCTAAYAAGQKLITFPVKVER